MAQQQMEKDMNEVVRVAEEIFRANGFRIVSRDNQLFPRTLPPLAAIKGERLLICTAKVYSATEQFLNPDEMNKVRDELNALVAKNRSSGNELVSTIEKVALVLVPGDITIASSEGDIKWVVVEDVDELPEEMDKVLA